MSLAIVVSRRIYVAALVVVALVVLFVIGSRWVRAQGLCEYVNFTTVCVKSDGSLRVIGNPADCKAKEVPAFLVNAEKLNCILGPMASNFQTALDQEKTDRMAADDEIWQAIEALQPPAP